MLIVKKEELQCVTGWAILFLEKIMAQTEKTKRNFATALKEMAEKTPLSKITIGALCDYANLNRKTFYYHFKDKEDLINWIFDREFLLIVKKLVSEVSVVNLNDRLLFEQLANYFYTELKFYKRVFAERGQNCFAEHFHDLLVNHYVQTSNLQKEYSVNFLANLYADVVVSSISRWVLQGCPVPPEEYVALMKRAVNSN